MFKQIATNAIVNSRATSKFLGFLYLLLGIGIILIVYKVYDKFFGKSQEQKDAEAQLASVKPNLQNATIDQGEAYKIASAIGNAVGTFNDDEDAIYTQFQYIKNQDDMKLVYKAFGIKSYGGILFTQKGDLIQFLQFYLSSNELEPIETKLSWI